MKALTGLWLAIALSVGVLAQDSSLIIESYPPGAEITESGQFLGLSGQPITLNKNPHQLTLKLKGHDSLDISLNGSDVASGRFPKTGFVTLTASSWRQAFQDFFRYRPWGVAGGALLLGLAMGGARRWRNLQRRQAALESLVAADGGEQRSLIMETIGGYRVVSPLGQGGMAEVYLAVPNGSLDMSAAVAIKVLNREMRDRPDLVERFEREIMISQELTHPGIVAVRGWGWHKERLNLTMELLDGQELRKVMPSLVGDWARVRDILSQLMTAVDHAHQRGVSHRDLKPENVMISEGGRVKVMDFGLGRAVDSKTLTQAGSALGTPRYIAPETVAGRGGDDLADQYSLGIIVFEMIVGRPPFDSDEVLFLLYSHANLEPAAPSSLVAVPPAVDQAILRMLAKDPRERFRTVEEARLALLVAMEDM